MQRSVRTIAGAALAAAALQAICTQAIAQEKLALPPIDQSQSVDSSINQNQSTKIIEGTEIPIRFEEKLSSSTSVTGDRFTISLAENVTLPDGVVLKEGYRGVGEVSSAEKRGFVGKAGELNLRLDYLRIGETRVRLRSNKAQQGKGSLGTSIALTVLFGPLGLLKRGADIEVQKGQEITAFVDSDTEIPLPLSPPPKPD